MSLDGTERGGKLDTDGQLWVGSSTLPKVRKSTLTSDSSLTMTYSEPTSTTGQISASINGPIPVATGGTGVSTTTAYTVQCGGTTSTEPLQSIASVGTSGQVLSSNGAGALPTFQSVSSGLGGTFISSVTIDDDSTAEFTSGISSTYNMYMFVFENVDSDSANNIIHVRTSGNAGSTWNSGASDYGYAYIKYTSAVFAAQDDSAVSILTGINPTSDSGSQLGAYFYLINPSGSKRSIFTYQSSWSRTTSSGCCIGGGARNSTTPVDGVQFYGIVGNLKSGKISMYGVTKPS